LKHFAVPGGKTLTIQPFQAVIYESN